MISKDVPIFLQSNSYECGLVCMAMVGNYYGRGAALEELREEFPLSKDGFSVADLIKMGCKLGLKCEAFKLNVEAVVNISVPAILHWKSNHFVVLERYSDLGFVIHDPAKGIQAMRHRQFMSQFSNVAIVVSKQ